MNLETSPILTKGQIKEIYRLLAGATDTNNKSGGEVSKKDLEKILKAKHQVEASLNALSQQRLARFKLYN